MTRQCLRVCKRLHVDKRRIRGSKRVHILGAEIHWHASGHEREHKFVLAHRAEQTAPPCAWAHAPNFILSLCSQPPVAQPAILQTFPERIDPDVLHQLSHEPISLHRAMRDGKHHQPLPPSPLLRRPIPLALRPGSCAQTLPSVHLIRLMHRRWSSWSCPEQHVQQTWRVGQRHQLRSSPVRCSLRGTPRWQRALIRRDQVHAGLQEASADGDRFDAEVEDALMRERGRQRGVRSGCELAAEHQDVGLVHVRERGEPEPGEVRRRVEQEDDGAREVVGQRREAWHGNRFTSREWPGQADAGAAVRVCLRLVHLRRDDVEREHGADDWERCCVREELHCVPGRALTGRTRACARIHIPERTEQQVRVRSNNGTAQGIVGPDLHKPFGWIEAEQVDLQMQELRERERVAVLLLLRQSEHNTRFNLSILPT
eukprot:1747587-Rhodomonas_salina.2